jgi:hypothetical protein
MEQDNKTTISPHELAKKFESQIKEVVSKKFSVAPADLSLLLEDREGVYLSKEEPNTLCIFVVGQKDGFLYLVTAKISADENNLDIFKSDIVS